MPRLFVIAASGAFRTMIGGIAGSVNISIGYLMRNERHYGVTARWRGGAAEKFPERYADYESPQSYRERFNDLSDKEFLQVARASVTWLNIARDQLSAEKLKNREPSRVRHVRGSSRVYPVAAPGGEYRWQFPGFKVRAGVLAEVLFALRTMGIQRVDLVDLRRAIDIYNKTSPRR